MKNSIWTIRTVLIFTVLLSACRSDPAPLSKPGPYNLGRRTFTYTDATRDNRRVMVTLWYPAVVPEGITGDPLQISSGLAPDLSGAPYPLLLSSTKVAYTFAPYLVSQGFTWVSVDSADSYPKMDENMVNQPLDILFVLDQVAAAPPEGLAGVIDADQAGVIGYSFDGYNALAMSGARIDSAYYLAQCPTPDATVQALPLGLSAFDCAPASAWDEFAALAGAASRANEDGLWQPMTDERIRAVMPLAGEGWWLFGERGLAAVDRPVLILVATQDELYVENVLIFEHLGTTDKTLISFVGRDHMMIYNTEDVARMAHFAAAFFGYHLQGRSDLAKYLSADYITRFDDLSWGPYTDK